MGGQASWLLPAALLAIAGRPVGDAASAADRSHPRRGSSCGAAGWSSAALVFSLSSGVIHTYYTVALAPAIAALVADRSRQSCGAGEPRPAHGR